jgi:hypothetical protein
MCGTQSTALERGTAASEAAALNGRTAAAKDCATSTAAKHRAAASEATAATTTSKTATAPTAMAAMPASHLGRQFAGNLLRCRCGGRIDQRQRLGALAWQSQRKNRGSRKAPATDKAAPGIWNRHHL